MPVETGIIKNNLPFGPLIYVSFPYQHRDFSIEKVIFLKTYVYLDNTATCFLLLGLLGVSNQEYFICFPSLFCSHHQHFLTQFLEFTFWLKGIYFFILKTSLKDIYSLVVSFHFYYSENSLLQSRTKFYFNYFLYIFLPVHSHIQLGTCLHMHENDQKLSLSSSIA